MVRSTIATFTLMMRLLVFLATAVLLVATQDAFAQRRNNRPVRGKVFPDTRYVKPTGFYFAPGVTYMMSSFWRKKDLGSTETEDAVFQAEARPFGSPGLFAEVGRYHILERWIYFEYLDYGIAYKSLRGTEAYDVTTLQKPDLTEDGTARTVGRFGDHFISGQFNLNHVFSITGSHMVQNTIGVNADYAFMANRLPGSVEQAAGGFPPRFQAGVHYKIGYGLKVSEKLLLIPSLETPILNVVQFESGRSSLKYFNSRYRPIIFSIRALIFRKQGLEACPPVFNPADPQELQNKWKKKQDRKRN